MITENQYEGLPVETGNPKIVNLTEHEVVIVLGKDSSSERKIYPPSGSVARIWTWAEKIGRINGVPLFLVGRGNIVDLPMEDESTYYIVSPMLQDAIPDRCDLVVPYALIKDEKGQIIGARGFSVRQMKQENEYSDTDFLVAFRSFVIFFLQYTPIEEREETKNLMIECIETENCPFDDFCKTSCPKCQIGEDKCLRFSKSFAKAAEYYGDNSFDNQLRAQMIEIVQEEFGNL